MMLPSGVKTVLRDLGLAIHVPGIMALLSLPVCLWFEESFARWPFLLTAIIAISVGQGLFWAFRGAEETRLRHGMIVAALAWQVVPLFAAIPFLAVAGELAGDATAPQTVLEFRNPLSAVFESFSGFTGTGLTMALRPSELPHCLQWWRSFTEWIGGVGVIVLMLAILRPSGAFHLYYSEGREEKIFPSLSSSVRTIWWIYLAYTAVSIVWLRIVGMPWWEAINHAMTAIATGGFGVTDHSLGDYSPAIRLAVIPVMLAGAVSFATHYLVLSELKLAALWRDGQHRLLWWFSACGSLLVALENYWAHDAFLWVDSAFQWISALSSAGFQSVELHGWSPTAQLLLSLAMIIGGASGSTAGGLKLARIVYLRCGLVWRFRRVTKRVHELVRYELDGKVISETAANELVESAGVLAVLWAVVLWAGVLVLIHFTPERFTLSEVILEVASAQSNVGLSTGITHPDMPWPGKLTLIACMWVGRLEIVPVMILVVGSVRVWAESRRKRVE
jgi:trk system potassium uptake protein